jgi:UDP-glucose 4-epimerase
MKKKCLVTGAAGFIGSHLVDKLIELGHCVIAVDNESAECNDDRFWNPKAQNYKCDICDAEELEKLFEGVDWVFHLAAESRIQPAILNPTKAVAVNVGGTCNVLQAARKHGVKRVIYSASSALYGRKNTPPLREDMPTDCLNPYSTTKYGGEEFCRIYHELYDMKTVSLRYFNVYGERQPTRGNYAPVVGLFARQKAAGGSMTIVGDGLQRRDFTHVSDVVKANLLAAKCEKPEAFGQSYNIGTGTNYNMIELAEMIGGDYVHIDPRPGEARNTQADISKANLFLEWFPQVNFKDWIKKTGGQG